MLISKGLAFGALGLGQCFEVLKQLRIIQERITQEGMTQVLMTHFAVFGEGQNKRG